jgi:acyl-CoA thioester hydrolase
VTQRRETVSEIRVRYAETDQMGVVYHTHYLVWCEVGRTDYIREWAMPYARLEQEGCVLAVAEVNIRYLAAARYDDLVYVTTWIERVQSRAITFGYSLASERDCTQQRIATATIKLIALDGAGAPRTLPDHLLRRFREEVDTNTN